MYYEHKYIVAGKGGLLLGGVKDDTVILGLKPLHSVRLGEPVGSTNLTGLPLPKIYEKLAVKDNHNYPYPIPISIGIYYKIKKLQN